MSEQSPDNLHRVQRLVGEFQRSVHERKSGDRLTLSIIILGGRGTGKSTLLRAAASTLSGKSRIALPLVDPELMHAGDSLMTWTLAGLESELGDDLLSQDLGDGTTIRKLINDLRRDHVLVSADLPRSLVQRGVGPAEYARDAAVLTPIGMAVTRLWTQLLDAIALASKVDDLVIVLPIDDVDLHSVRLTSILTQLEALKTSKRFISILAADESALINNILFGDADEADQWDRAVKAGLALPQELAVLAERKLTKHFPRQFRVRLSDVLPEHRLDFAPTEETSRSLGELLAQFPINSSGLRSLRDIFETRASDGSVLATNGYAAALSGNRRDLQQLCSALTGLLASTETRDAGSALSLIVEHGLQSCRHVVPKDVRDALTLVRLHDRIQITFNLSDLVFGKTVVRGTLIHNPNERTHIGNDIDRENDPRSVVYMRRIAEFYAGILVASPQSNERSEQSPHRTSHLPAMFTQLLFLAWEATEIETKQSRSLIEAEGALGNMVLPGLGNWTGTLSDEDDETLLYLVVPDWESYSDYYSYQYVWNGMRDTARRLSLEGARTRNLLEYIILAHISTVTNIQRAKTVNKKFLDYEFMSITSDTEAWDQLYGDLLASLREDLSNLLVSIKETARTSTRAGDFLSWLAVGLPLATSRNIATSRLSTDIFQIWLDLDLDNFQRRRLSNHLVKRLPRYVTEPAAVADIDLLAKVDPDRSAAMSNVRQARGERLNMIRQNLMANLQSANVGDDLLNRLNHDGATVEVLAALNAVGVSNSDLPRIAEYFPAQDRDGDITKTDMNA